MPVVAADAFAKMYPDIGSNIMPPAHHFAITPSDTDDMAVVVREIYIGTAGNLTVHMAGDAANANVLYKMLAGTFLCGRFDRVLATGTTATDLVGRW